VERMALLEFTHCYIGRRSSTSDTHLSKFDHFTLQLYKGREMNQTINFTAEVSEKKQTSWTQLITKARDLETSRCWIYAPKHFSTPILQPAIHLKKLKLGIYLRFWLQHFSKMRRNNLKTLRQNLHTLFSMKN